MDRVEFYLFRTNLTCDREIHKLAPYLDGTVIHGKWHFDLEDCDKVLCLTCTPETKATVEHLISIKGFLIEELHYLESEVRQRKAL